MSLEDDILALCLPSESESLNSAALQEALQRIRERKGAVSERIAGVVADAAAAGPLPDAFVAALGPLAGSGELLLEQLAGHSERHAALRCRLSDAEAEADALQAAAALAHDVAEIEERLARGELAAAAELVEGFAAAADRAGGGGPEPDEGDEQHRYAAKGEELRAAHTRWAAKVRAAVDSAWASSLVIDAPSGCVHVAPLSSDLWAALRITGAYVAAVRGAASSLLTSLLLPAARGQVSVSTLPDGGGGGTLSWRPSPTQHRWAADSAVALTATLGFLSETLFAEGPAAALDFGRATWPDCAAEVLEGVWPGAAARRLHEPDASDVAAAIALEADAARMGFLADGQGLLATELAKRERAMFRQTQMPFLEAAQAALRATWQASSTALVGGRLHLDADVAPRAASCALDAWEIADPELGVDPTKPLLDQGLYLVPPAATRVVHLMGEMLEAAAARDCQRGSADALIAGACDVALMTRAVPRAMMTKREGTHAPALRDTLLLHNMCRYVGDFLALAPIEIGPGLLGATRHPVQALVTACDAMHRAADAAMAQSVDSTLGSIMQALEGTDELSRLTSGHRVQTAKDAVAAAALILREFADTVRATCTPGAMILAVGDTLEATCACVMASVMQKDDITIMDCDELPGVLAPLSGPELLDSLCGGEATKSPNKHAAAAAPVPQDLVRASGVGAALLRAGLLARATALPKLRQLVLMLNARLVKITEWWEDGTLAGAGFSSREVLHLVQALFEETDLRQECIARIIAATPT